MTERSAPRWNRSGLFLALTLVFGLGAWLSSGTMTPYAASYDNPHILQPCQYLANIDHHHFIAGFHLVAGDSRDTWERSHLLRRILYPVLAFPFVTHLGFEWGGLVANTALNLLGIAAFLRFLCNRYGERRAIVAGALLATYPGATYWIGLPYSYALIVPSSLILTMVLYRLDEASNVHSTLGWSLVMGVLFLGYDLMPIFLPAAVTLLLWRRRVRFAAVTAVASLIPTAVVAGILAYGLGVPVVNENTGVYGTVLRSYLGQFDSTGWLPLLAEVPGVLVETFLAGNFFVLPVLFLLALILDLFERDQLRFDGVETALLLSLLGLFLFNNLAPPYPHWQMRGMWIPRLYQPAFVIYVLYVARSLDMVQRCRRSIVVACVLLAVTANAAIVISPLLGWRPGLEAYARFYKHAPLETMARNLRVYGHRPLGFCQPP